RLLAGVHPGCPVRRLPVDLRDRSALRAALTAGDLVGGPSIVITEGLLVYLTPADLGSLAATLFDAPGPVRRLADLVSTPSAQAMGVVAARAGAGLRLFGLDDLDIFDAAGWTASEYRILPVARRGGHYGRSAAGAGSRTVVDGVVAFDPVRIDTGTIR